MGWLRRAVTVALAMLLIIGCSGTSTPTPSPTPTPTPSPVVAEAPVTIGGSGSLQTAPFALAGGNYRIAVTATDVDDYGCTFGGLLHSTDGDVRESMGTIDPGAGATLTGESWVYGIPAGSYYVQSIATCDWTATLSPG